MATYRLNLYFVAGDACSPRRGDEGQKPSLPELRAALPDFRIDSDPAGESLLVSVEESGLRAYGSVSNALRELQHSNSECLWDFQLLPAETAQAFMDAQGARPYAVQRDRLARGMMRYETGVFAEELLESN